MDYLRRPVRRAVRRAPGVSCRLAVPRATRESETNKKGQNSEAAGAHHTPRPRHT